VAGSPPAIPCLQLGLTLSTGMEMLFLSRRRPSSTVTVKQWTPVCTHGFLLHGQFLSHRTGPIAHRKMVPQLSYCPTLLHHDIMAAMPINWIHDILPRSDDPEWDNKIEECLQWRGSNTGIWHANDTRWRVAQRARLIEWATKNYGENLTVLMPPKDENQKVGKGVPMKKGILGPVMLDVFFAGQPLSCAPETCEQLKQIYEYRQPQDVKTAGNYKYIIDASSSLFFFLRC
jgi:hypothetical protein